MGLYIVVCLVFGTTFGFIKIGIEEGFSPFLFAGIRFLVAGFLLLAFTYFKNLWQRISAIKAPILPIVWNL